MKLFSYLFSFYILILSCMPCADRDEDRLNGKQKNTIQTAGHKSSEEHNEICTPFCTCGCCGHQSAFGLFSILIKFVVTADEKKQAFIFNQDFVSTYPGNIWQPPKLS